MKATIVLLSILSLAHAISPSAASSQSRSLNNQPSPSSSPSSSSEDHSWWQPVPPALQEFIAKFNSPHGHESTRHEEDTPADLRRRQKAPNGGPLESSTIATQMSPVTTYMANGTPVIYTQTFVPTPVPWAGPVNGQIGMGTIQGAIGTVRTDS